MKPLQAHFLQLTVDRLSPRAMRTPSMIVIKKGIRILLSKGQLLNTEGHVTEFFAPECAIERFNEGLLVLLVGACNAMVSGPARHAFGALRFELRTAIGLEEVHSPKTLHHLVERQAAIAGLS